MTAFYSPSEQGFFDTRFHSKDQIPDDAVEVDEDRRRALITGMSQGLSVRVTKAGACELFEPPADPDALANLERGWRDGVLAVLLGMRDRHRDQIEIGADTTLTAEQFTELLTYMQALRDWPQSTDFPDTTHRPKPPAWLAEQV